MAELDEPPSAFHLPMSVPLGRDTPLKRKRASEDLYHPTSAHSHAENESHRQLSFSNLPIPSASSLIASPYEDTAAASNANELIYHMVTPTSSEQNSSRYIPGHNVFEGGMSDVSGPFLSPVALSVFDEYAANPKFLELQEELRAMLFDSVVSQTPTRAATPELADSERQRADPKSVPRLMRSVISTAKRAEYLKNWITEVAPWLDMFDMQRHFGIQVPIMAQTSPPLLYAILALSARQYERKRGLKGSYDSLELYQDSIRLLTPLLEAKDPNVLVTSVILCCLEMMSVSPRDWRRHVEGCAALFDVFDVNGFSGGLLQAVFWCFARMDLCGAIISDGKESTVLPLDQWVPPGTSEGQVGEMFRLIQVPDMHANYAVYLCSRACDLLAACTKFTELQEQNGYDNATFMEKWSNLWKECHQWARQRPPELLPVRTISASKTKPFPEIFYVQWAAISSNQLYHTACILLLDIMPSVVKLDPKPVNSAIWHARQICGISMTNPHRGCLNNAIQPLWVAGKLLSHPSEHRAVVKIIRQIESMTGWGAIWRIKDLEEAWGYEEQKLD
jgi:hypothetical protein